MESLVADISDLKLEEKFKRFWWKVNSFIAIHEPQIKFSAATPNDLENCTRCENEEEDEQTTRDKLEAEIPEAELEEFQLRYIPDYVRELRNKKDYWQKEYLFWNDLISEKKWKEYEKKLNGETIKLKTVIKNLDKELHRPENHLSHSLDAERVQALVDYIKEKESNDGVLQAMLNAAIFSFDHVQRAYVYVAIYATYGEYRHRPSRPSSLQVKKED